MSALPDTLADIVESAEVFLSVGDAKRSGDYERGALELGEYLDSDPDLHRDRLRQLIGAGALVTSDLLRAKVPRGREGFWALRPVHPDHASCPAEDLAAMRVLTATCNGDHEAARDVIEVHEQNFGADGVLDLLAAMLSLYAATMDGGLPW
jgi:hypothetical protein